MSEDQGSLERAVAGDYEFTVGEVLNEAWEKVSGSKLQIVGGMFIYLIIASLATGFINFFISADKFYNSGQMWLGAVTDILIGFITLPVTVPLYVGVLLLGYAKANDQEVNIQSIFDYYVIVWPLVFAAFLVTVFTYIGLILLIIPGIYLAVSYTFVMPLIIDKKLDVWGAMEVSRRAVTTHWFTVFGVNFSIMILMLLSLFTLGIAMIWTLPLALIAQGVMYRKIFGWNVHDPIQNGTETITQ